MNRAAEVITALAAARRGVQLYPVTHPAYVETLDALTSAVVAAAETTPLVINSHQGRLYHDSSVLPEDIVGMRAICEALEGHHIESLSFKPGFTRDDALGLTQVLSLRHSPDLDVEEELKTRSVIHVGVSVLEDERHAEREERDRQRQADIALYRRTVAALRQLQQRFAGGAAGDLGETPELVTHIMGRLLSDSSAVLGLATIKGTTERTLFHSLNVMIYALALGQRLKLAEQGLMSLGMSALLHDVGKAAFVTDDPDQLAPMRLLHPETGATILQRVALEDPAPMLVAYEHHMMADGSGWPERPADYITHPYSRMVAIADRYENLVSPPNGDAAFTPDKAIVQVLKEGETALDPIFSRMFASALGVFPVGCLVRLSDHSVGIVSRCGEDPLAPVVRLVYDDRGSELTERPDVDLSESEVRIVEVLEPESLDLTIAEKL